MLFSTLGGSRVSGVSGSGTSTETLRRSASSELLVGGRRFATSRSVNVRLCFDFHMKKKKNRSQGQVNVPECFQTLPKVYDYICYIDYSRAIWRLHIDLYKSIYFQSYQVNRCCRRETRCRFQCQTFSTKAMWSCPYVSDTHRAATSGGRGQARARRGSVCARPQPSATRPRAVGDSSAARGPHHNPGSDRIKAQSLLSPNSR